MKYIVKYNAGYGDEYEEIEATDEESAEKVAYHLWKEAVENEAVWCVVGEATDELRDEYL